MNSLAKHERTKAMQQAQQKELLSVREAAEHCSVSPNTVYGWLRSGTLKHLRLPGNGERSIVKIDRSVLDRFLKQNTF